MAFSCVAVLILQARGEEIIGGIDRLRLARRQGLQFRAERGDLVRMVFQEHRPPRLRDRVLRCVLADAEDSAGLLRAHRPARIPGRPDREHAGQDVVVETHLEGGFATPAIHPVVALAQWDAKRFTASAALNDLLRGWRPGRRTGGGFGLRRPGLLLVRVLAGFRARTLRSFRSFRTAFQVAQRPLDLLLQRHAGGGGPVIGQFVIQQFQRREVGRGFRINPVKLVGAKI